MATTRKVLGQSAPSATTNTTLYTVPASTSTVCSTLQVCNRGTSATTFRVAIRPNGATLANEHYIYYDVALPANDAFAATLGITLGAADVITVYAGNGNLSFSVFGGEES